MAAFPVAGPAAAAAMDDDGIPAAHVCSALPLVDRTSPIAFTSAGEFIIVRGSRGEPRGSFRFVDYITAYISDSGARAGDEPFQRQCTLTIICRVPGCDNTNTGHQVR